MAFDADHQRQPRGADVRGMGEHFGHRQHAMRGVKIVNREPPVAQAVARVHMRAEIDLAGFERHRERKRLEGRTHFVDADIDAVDLGRIAHVARVVGIEVGQRFQRQHFAGVDVDDHARRGLGVEAIHSVDQFVAQRMRRLEIERQADRLQALGIDREAGDMRIGQALLVEIFLHARDADIVLVDEPDHMGANRAVGIDALVLRQKADAGQAEVKDFGLLLRRDLPLDPDEALLRRQPLAQLLRVDVGKHSGDELNRFVLVDDAIGLGEHRHGPDVTGEDRAVPIKQIGPRARNRVIGRRLQRLRRIMRKAEHEQLHADPGIGHE